MNFYFPQRMALMIPGSIIIHLLPWEFGNVMCVSRGGSQGPSASVFGRGNRLHSDLQKLLTLPSAIFGS